MNPPARRQSESLWAITSYFNPMGYRRRLANYRIFRAGLNIPLVTVELGFDADFELGPKDAEVLIQLQGGDVLWQKERLLNVALQALPSECSKVAWLDCDVVFGADDWSERLTLLLDRFGVVQPFSCLHHLLPDWAADEVKTTRIDFTQSSVANDVAAGMPAATSLDYFIDSRRNVSGKGYAWAARRELLDQHGFYDACIVGGGDRAMDCAFYGCMDVVTRIHCMNDRQRDHYAAWAEACSEMVRGDIGFLECDLFHLWHGEMSNRQGHVRHEGLKQFHFDPFEDIIIDPNGCWRWNTDKGEMRKYLRDYFALRKEDG